MASQSPQRGNTNGTRKNNNEIDNVFVNSSTPTIKKTTNMESGILKHKKKQPAAEMVNFMENQASVAPNTIAHRKNMTAINKKLEDRSRYRNPQESGTTRSKMNALNSEEKSTTKRLLNNTDTTDAEKREYRSLYLAFLESLRYHERKIAHKSDEDAKHLISILKLEESKDKIIKEAIYSIAKLYNDIPVMIEEISKKFGLIIYLSFANKNNASNYAINGSENRKPIVTSNFNQILKDLEVQDGDFKVATPGQTTDEQLAQEMKRSYSKAEIEAKYQNNSKNKYANMPNIIILSYNQTTQTFASKNEVNADKNSYQVLLDEIKKQKITVYDLHAQTEAIQKVISENVKDHVWEDGIDKDSEGTVWKIGKIVMKYFFAVLFLLIFLVSCLVTKFSILELAKIRPTVQRLVTTETSILDENSNTTSVIPISTMKSVVLDRTPLLPLAICLLCAEGIGFLLSSYQTVFKKDTAHQNTSFDWNLLFKLIISELVDLVGESTFVLYILVRLRFNVTIFSMSTIYLFPLLLKVYYPSVYEQGIFRKIMIYVAVLLNLGLYGAVITFLIIDLNWYTAVIHAVCLLCMSQRLFWNYLPISASKFKSGRKNDKKITDQLRWWSISTELEFYRFRFSFYISLLRFLVTFIICIVVSYLDFQSDEFVFSERNEILTEDINFLNWFVLPTYAVIILQVVSGYLAFYFAYTGATTRMQRFTVAIPAWLVQILSITLMLVYCRDEEQIGSDEIYNKYCSSKIASGNISDNDGEDWLNADRYLIIGIAWCIISFFIAVVATSHVWTEHKPLMRSSHLFSFDVFSTASGMMESLILRNLKLDTKTPSESLAGRVLRQIHSAFLKDPFLTSITNGSYTPGKIDERARKNNEKAFAKYKRPFIYACPTLYRETDYEMKQLFVSCLRLNKDQLISQIKDFRFGKVDTNQETKEYQPYDIEFNVFFDQPFDFPKNDEKEKNSNKIVLNSYVKQLHRIMLEGVKSVRFNEQIFRLQQTSNEDQSNPPKIALPVITETPYGIQLTYELPLPDGKFKDFNELKPNIFRVHLKDPKKIQAGKRFSQCLYLYWLLGYRSENVQLGYIPDDKEFSANKNSFDTDDRENFILALDGDVDFQPQALKTLLNRMARSPKNGAACGRIYPLGNGPVYWFQVWEYAIGHWLQKATEDILGSVLCSPGCFSLVRADALLHDVDSNPNSIITKYVRRPNGALDWIQWNMGEDRWMCTLLLERGWRIEYVALSDAWTYAPTDFGEFFKQRRRWGPSTVFNIYDLIKESKRTRKLNDSISFGYIIYQFTLQLSSFLALATVAMVIQGSLEFVLNVDSIVSLIVALAPIILFTAICFLTEKSTQLFWVNILTIFYFLFMLVVFIAIVVSIVQPLGLCNLSNLFTIGIFGVYLITGLLHIKEAHPFKETLYTLFVYTFLSPTAFILLNIYQFVNLNETSWGTREKKSDEAKAGNGGPKNNNIYAGNHFGAKTFNLSNWFYCHCCPDEDDFKKYNEQNSERIHGIGSHEENEVRNNDETASIISQKPISQIGNGSIYAGSTVSNTKNWTKRHFQQNHGTSNFDPIEEEDRESVMSMREQQFREEVKPMDIKCQIYDVEELKKMSQKENKKDDFKHQKLSSKEHNFFHFLVSTKLKPANQTQKEKDELTASLKELRDQFCLAFFLFNFAWILITYMISRAFVTTGTELKFTIPIQTASLNCSAENLALNNAESAIHPMNLFFLLFYIIVMGLQFMCMLLHRWETIKTILAETPFLTEGSNSIEEASAEEKESDTDNNISNQMTRASKYGQLNPAYTENDIEMNQINVQNTPGIYINTQSNSDMTLHGQKARFRTTNLTYKQKREQIEMTINYNKNQMKSRKSREIMSKRVSKISMDTNKSRANSLVPHQAESSSASYFKKTVRQMSRNWNKIGKNDS